MTKFKVGDKVRRSGLFAPWIDEGRKKDDVCTIARIDNSIQIINLEEIAGGWSAENFELVPQLPCIQNIPPVPARRKITSGFLYAGSSIYIMYVGDVSHRASTPYWLYQPMGGMSSYWSKADLIQLRDALTEVIEVISEEEKYAKE